MTLTVINPTPTKRSRKMATKKRKKGMPAGLKKYWASKRRAKNPSSHHTSKRKATKRRRYGVATRKHHSVRRVHRNPSMGGSGSLFGELLSKDGLMMAGAVLATPTVIEMGTRLVMPTATGYTRIGVKAALGVAAAFLVHKFVNKKAGFGVALATVATAGAEAIRTFQNAPNPVIPGVLQGYDLNGYALNGYGSDPGSYMMGYGPGLMDDMADDLSDDMSDDLADCPSSLSGAPEPGLRMI